VEIYNPYYGQIIYECDSKKKWNKSTFFPRYKNKGDKKGMRRRLKIKAINSFAPTCVFALISNVKC